MKLIILSGRSGAGKSVALRVFEDQGYYCVDNLPVALLLQLLQNLEDVHDRVAVSIDIRNLLPLQEIDLIELRARIPAGIDAQTFFLDASDECLMRRYSETRRIHPLSKDGTSLTDAISEERRRLGSLVQNADHHIKTDDLSVYDLADQIRTRLLGKTDTNMILVFESFGFKHGMPKQADYLFDVRFLPNPHWEPELRAHTGLEQPVIDFFGKHGSVERFIDSTERFLLNWLPMLERNNRAYLTVAIGCTGGKHRSVFIAEQLHQRFSKIRDHVSVRHRELKSES